MPKHAKGPGARRGARGPRTPRLPELLSAGQQPSRAVVTHTPASPSTSDVQAVGASALALSDDATSDSSAISHHTLPGLTAYDAEEPASMPRSVSAGALDTRRQLERLLLSSLDHDQAAQGAPHPRAALHLDALADGDAVHDAAHDAAHDAVHRDADDAGSAARPDAHAAPRAAEGAVSASDASAEAATETRHVYFDEQRLTRQSSRQFWHHEARHARRAVFQPASPHLDKRQAMESFLQRVQAQIEDAGQRLRTRPSPEWPLLTSAGGDTPCAEPLAYEVRRTLRPRAQAPVWDEPPRAVRPLGLAVHATLEVHAPFLSSFAPASAAMHVRLADVAYELVGRALVRRRAGRAENVPRANGLLALLPLPVLARMHGVLETARTAGWPYPGWLRPLLRAHRPFQLQLVVLRATVPTLLLYRTNLLLVTALELVLVALQLALCAVLAGYQRLVP